MPACASRIERESPHERPLRSWRVWLPSWLLAIAGRTGRRGRPDAPRPGRRPALRHAHDDVHLQVTYTDNSSGRHWAPELGPACAIHGVTHWMSRSGVATGATASRTAGRASCRWARTTSPSRPAATGRHGHPAPPGRSSSPSRPPRPRSRRRSRPRSRRRSRPRSRRPGRPPKPTAQARPRPTPTPTRRPTPSAEAGPARQAHAHGDARGSARVVPTLVDAIDGADTDARRHAAAVDRGRPTPTPAAEPVPGRDRRWSPPVGDPARPGRRDRRPDAARPPAACRPAASRRPRPRSARWRPPWRSSGSPPHLPPLPLMPTVVTTTGVAAASMASGCSAATPRRREPGTDEVLAASAAEGVGGRRGRRGRRGRCRGRRRSGPRRRRPRPPSGDGDAALAPAVAAAGAQGRSDCGQSRPPPAAFDQGLSRHARRPASDGWSATRSSACSTPPTSCAARDRRPRRGRRGRAARAAGRLLAGACPDGGRGWIHKMTLGDERRRSAARSTAPIGHAADRRRELDDGRATSTTTSWPPTSPRGSGATSAAPGPCAAPGCAGARCSGRRRADSHTAAAGCPAWYQIRSPFGTSPRRRGPRGQVRAGEQVAAILVGVADDDHRVAAGPQDARDLAEATPIRSRNVG